MSDIENMTDDERFLELLQGALEVTENNVIMVDSAGLARQADQVRGTGVKQTFELIPEDMFALFVLPMVSGDKSMILIVRKGEVVVMYTENKTTFIATENGDTSEIGVATGGEFSRDEARVHTEAGMAMLSLILMKMQNDETEYFMGAEAQMGTLEEMLEATGQSLH